MRAAIPLIVQSPSSGSIVAGATVTITKTIDGSAATIYTSRTGGGNLGTNAATTDAEGRLTSAGFELWLEQGTYDFTITGTNLTTRTLTREIVSGDGIQETVPIGGMLFWPGPTLPTGFSYAYGAEVSRASFAALFAALTKTQQGTLTNGVNTITGLTDTSRMKIGDPLEGTGIQAGATVASVTSGTAITMSATATVGGAQTVRHFPHGKASTTTFTLPNMTQRTAIGKASSGVGVNFGEVGGETAHLLSASESGLPAHNHAASSGNAGSHSHTLHSQNADSSTATQNWPNFPMWRTTGTQFDAFPQTDPVGDHAHAITVSNVAAAAAASSHNNMSPYLAADWIIRHGVQ